MAIAYQLCFRVCHQEGSGKLGWLEIKWYILAFDLCCLIYWVETLVVASKEIGLQVNAVKYNYMVVS